MVVLLGRPVSDFDRCADTIETLPGLMRAARERLGITTKTQAAQVGVGTDTLARVEAGANVTRDTIVQCLRWLAVN